EAIRSVVEARPDQEVLVSGSMRLTNRELLRRIETLSNGLAGMGLQKGDKLVLLLPPGPEFVYLFFALASLGAVVVPLNPDIHERGLREVLEDARPAALVASRSRWDDEFRQAHGLRHIIPVEGEGQDLTLAALMKDSARAQPPVPVAPDDLLALLYTSGTTGKPKATMHTHRSLIAAVVATLKVRELWLRPSNLRTAMEAAKALARYRSRLMRSIGRPQTFLSCSRDC
ncbi:MAG: AMP-binding protein, partial [Anaerolineales bacterium]